MQYFQFSPHTGVVGLPAVDETDVFGFVEFVFIVIVDKSVFTSVVLGVVVVVVVVVGWVVNSIYQNKSIFEYYRKNSIISRNKFQII